MLLRQAIKTSVLVIAVGVAEGCCFSEECCPGSPRTFGICHPDPKEGVNGTTAGSTSLPTTTSDALPTSTYVATTGSTISTDSNHAADSSTATSTGVPGPQTSSSADVDTGASSSGSDETGKPIGSCHCKFEASGHDLPNSPVVKPWFVAQFYDLSANDCDGKPSAVTSVILMGTNWSVGVDAEDNPATVKVRIRVYDKDDGALLARSEVTDINPNKAENEVFIQLENPMKPIDTSGFWVSYFFGDMGSPEEVPVTDTEIIDKRPSIVCFSGSPPEKLPLDPNGTCSNNETPMYYLPVRLTLSSC